MTQSKWGLCWVALALCLLCACTSSPVTSTQHSVTLVAKSTQTEFWLSVFAGAEAAATEYNLSLNILGPETEEDYESQNQMVADAVEAGAEALVFSAIDYENNAQAIDEAARAGVKIVAIDSNVDSDAVSTYIGTDNYAAGQMAAQAALEGRQNQAVLLPGVHRGGGAVQHRAGARLDLGKDEGVFLIQNKVQLPQPRAVVVVQQQPAALLVVLGGDGLARVADVSHASSPAFSESCGGKTAGCRTARSARSAAWSDSPCAWQAGTAGTACPAPAYSGHG